MSRWDGLTLEEKFWDKVNKTETCWLWTASVNNRGYGQFNTAKLGKKGMSYAHRVSYQLSVGPIPEGLVLDHLCRVIICVNPDHLEIVTQRENSLRGLNGRMKTHCINGHEFDEKNTYYRKDTGARLCRRCGVIRNTARRRAVRARERASERMTTCRHCACLVDVWVEEGEKDYYFHDCEHPTHDHRAEVDKRIAAQEENL